MALNVSDLKPGDVVAHWFEQGGGFGAALVYSRVLKVGLKKIRVRCETGGERWKYPQFFDRKVADDKIDALQINWQ